MVDAEYGTQFLLGVFFLPLGQSLDRLILYVGLRQAELEITGHDRIQVKHRSAGGFNCRPDSMRVAPVVDHLCNGQAGWKIDAGEIAGSNGYKNGFGLKFSRTGMQNETDDETGDKGDDHLFLHESLFFKCLMRYHDVSIADRRNRNSLSNPTGPGDSHLRAC